MAIGVDFKTLVDIRPVGGEIIVSDYYDIPGPPMAGTVTTRTNEIPLDVPFPASTDALDVRVVDPVTHLYTGGTVFTAVYAPTLPLVGQYQIDSVATFKLGTIKLNLLDGGQTVEIRCTGRGSAVFASDVNDPRDEIKDARDTETDMGTRLGLIEDGTRILDEAILPRHISVNPSDIYTFPGDVVIAGGLDVQGTITYIESTTVNINDNIITLAAGTVGAPVLDAGITIERGSSTDALMVWRETTDNWEMTQGGLTVNGNFTAQGGSALVGSFIGSGGAFSTQVVLIASTDGTDTALALANGTSIPADLVATFAYNVATNRIHITDGSNTIIDISRATSNVGINSNPSATNKLTIGGHLDITSGSLYKINNVQISSAALSNDAALIKTSTTMGGDLTGNLPSALLAFQREDYVAGTPSGTYTGSLTVINLPWTYTIGSKKLLFIKNGMIRTVGGANDYTETSTSSITTTVAMIAGETISVIRIGG